MAAMTILPALLLPLVLPQDVTAPTPPSLDDRLSAVLQGLVDAGMPGASASIVLRDGSQHSVAVGLADLATREALTPDHRLLLGSTGKTFVSAQAMLLSQAGELDLDQTALSVFPDDDSDWLRALPNGDSFTLRQLMGHRAGLPRYVYHPEFGPAMSSDPERVWTPPELLAYVAGAEPLFAPGKGWAYADTSYIVLGMAMEERMGESFYGRVLRTFIEPLGLKDTLPSNRRRIESMAQGHVVLGKQLGTGDLALGPEGFTYNVQFEWCGGGFASNPRDLARWARMLFSGRLHGERALGAMLATTPARSLGPETGYGLGVMVRPTEMGELRYHDGFMPGYVTSLGYFPEHDMGVSLQCNGDDLRLLRRPMSEVLVELARLAAE